MTTPTDPPEWALEETQKLIVCGCTFYAGSPPCKKCTDFALALDAARRRGIEEAAHYTACRSPFEHPTTIAVGIRALADKEPT